MGIVVETEGIELDETPDTVEIQRVSTTPVKGICRHCGAAARSDTSTVCEEHDGRRTRHGNTSGVSRAPKAPRKARTKGGPSADDWTNRVLSKVLVAITLLMATAAIKRRGIHDPADELADYLAMSNDEAVSISRPFARMIAGTQLNAKYGSSVIENVDVLDAGFAFYDWQKRVSVTLSQYQQRHLATVTDINREETATEGVVNNGTNDPQNPSVGEWAGALPDGITGEHFI